MSSNDYAAIQKETDNRFVVTTGSMDDGYPTFNQYLASCQTLEEAVKYAIGLGTEYGITVYREQMTEEERLLQQNRFLADSNAVIIRERDAARRYALELEAQLKKWRD